MLATTQDDRLSIETEVDCIEWNPADDSFLQAGQDLTTHVPRRPALLLHCAKIRGGGAARNFVAGGAPRMKFYAGF
jgi:hypothetical protein